MGVFRLNVQASDPTCTIASGQLRFVPGNNAHFGHTSKALFSLSLTTENRPWIGECPD
jgi:hypothetical protein